MKIRKLIQITIVDTTTTYSLNSYHIFPTSINRCDEILSYHLPKGNYTPLKVDHKRFHRRSFY